MDFFAFSDELQKIAFGPYDADKVLKVVKRIQVRAGGRAGTAYAGSPGVTKSRKEFVATLVDAGLPRSEITKELVNVAVPVRGFIRKGPTVLTPERGGGAKFLRTDPTVRMISKDTPRAVRSVKTPAQHKMLESVLKGHELAETQVKPTWGMGHFGHRSPDVLLREHNMLTTLPKGMEPVGNTMRALRAGREASALREFTGVKFGKGSRYSRHARKRLLELYQKNFDKKASV